MKLTFTGESLNDIHFQIKQAAKELNDNVSWPTDNTPVVDTKQDVDVQPATPWKEFTDQERVKPDTLKPYVPTVQAVQPTNSADVDTKGVMYDPSIHTSTRARKQDGSWKLRPGGAGGATKTQPASEPANAASMERAAIQQGFVSTEPSVVHSPSKPDSAAAIQHHENAGPAIGQAPGLHNFESFKSNLMTIVVRLINEGKMDRAYMQELNQFFGVNNLWDVKNDDAKAKQLFDLFIQYQFIMGA